jgi:primosomal protein N' (replication factor Y)
VIGVRSAILAPVERVGLIIVDEEHDGSYKQSDPEPRYHARDVAIMRGHFQQAVVVLGSATPSLESYHNAQRAKYHLITLSQRFGTAVLPRVAIVDMNKEHEEKNNWTFLSLELKGRIEQMLEQKRQVILLLNRRGFSTFLLCKDCGHIHSCPYCSVHLTYHRVETALKCHQCGHQVAAPDLCPACGGGQLQYKGTGIQKAEEVLRETIPHARIIRMDQDTTRRKGAHVSLLEAFGSGQADILLGTQMVAKGLDFPRVGLVGVLQADTGLHVPDFRASERTFQLLTQVAGRAGRADAHGEVVIQTYLPQDPAIRASQMHDYQQFIAQELEFRKALSYPPFCRLARIIVTSENESAALSAIETLAGLVDCDNRTIKRLGPAAAAVARIKSFYRFSMVLKSASARTLQQTLQQMRTQARSFPRTIKCIIDVDPGHML